MDSIKKKTKFSKKVVSSTKDTLQKRSKKKSLRKVKKSKGNEKAKSEIFIGLVGATGSDLGSIENYIRIILSEFGYNNVYKIKISDFFAKASFQEYFNKASKEYKKKYKESIDAFQEIYVQMEIGKKIREKEGYSILAKYAVQQVQKLRKQNPKRQGSAYIFQSLKHPSEAKLLSDIYGVGYYQIGVYSSEDQRITFLKKRKSIKRPEAYTLIDKDIGEDSAGGQQTRNTFQLSDFFIKHSNDQADTTKLKLERFFDLIFGHPYLTPTIDEHMMYMAYSYATRSADLSRQVGAVLSSKFGDIIGLGSNDVPCAGGGPYWPNPERNNSQDWRDYRRGEDANQIMKNKMVTDIMKAVGKQGNDKDLLEEGLSLLKTTDIDNITEFGRATHAEMSAILSCNRIGVSPKGGILYCTTFPCHNCAKHIVESGIKKVLFVEPYPKSHAKALHDDSISFPSSNKTKDEEDKVTFDHFIGVATRRYLDLFSLKLGMGVEISRKDLEGKTKNFKRKNANIRTPLITSTYLDKEKEKINEI